MTQVPVARSLLDCVSALEVLRKHWRVGVPTARDPATRADCPRFEIVDSDYGCIEQRRHMVYHGVEWPTSHRRFPDQRQILGLRNVSTKVRQPG
jgi:hypothetical protein